MQDKQQNAALNARWVKRAGKERRHVGIFDGQQQIPSNMKSIESKEYQDFAHS